MNEENGKNKAFELAPVKTPEQVESETKRKIAPQIRDAVFKMKLQAQVKFFFAALLDITFLYKYGGDGRGRIWTNVQKLSRLFKHDKDSITKWRDRLAEENLIWVSNGWPTQQWRICALYPAPEDYRPAEEDYILGRAGAAEKEESGNLPQGVFLSQNQKSPQISEEIRRSAPKTPAHHAEGIGTVRGNLPHCKGNPSPHNRGNLPQGAPKPSATCAEVLGKGIPIPSALCSDKSRTTKETPIGEFGGLEAKLEGKGSLPPKIELLKAFKNKAWGSWALSLAYKYQRELKELRVDLLSQQKQLEPGDQQIPDIAERLDAIDIALYGGKRPQPARKPARPAMPALQQRPPTQEETLTGARYLLENGKAHKLTRAMKEALAQAKVKK